VTQIAGDSNVLRASADYVWLAVTSLARLAAPRSSTHWHPSPSLALGRGKGALSAHRW